MKKLNIILLILCLLLFTITITSIYKLNKIQKEYKDLALEYIETGNEYCNIIDKYSIEKNKIIKLLELIVIEKEKNKNSLLIDKIVEILGE